MLNFAHVDNRRSEVEIQQEGLAYQPSAPRCAIYYTPQPGTALAAFGRSWFGRANDGATLQAFSSAGLAGSVNTNVTPIRRHTGLHAVVMGPFALRDGVGREDVRTRLIDLAAHRKRVETGPLTLARAGRYLVLRPVEPKSELDWLATQCISAFEGFASASEPSPDSYSHLNSHQRLLLKSFGHHKVMSEYRFSITLAGPLAPAHLERVSQALFPVIEHICAEGVAVDGLSLFGNGGGETPMRLISRFALGN